MDLGHRDRAAVHVLGGNAAVRREAFERVGFLSESLSGWGDEEEWQRRLRAAGGTVGYVADAWVWHRKTSVSLRLTALLVSRFKRGVKQTQFRCHQREAVKSRSEFVPFFRGLGHAVRCRCCWGLLAASESAGRVWGTLGS